MQLNTSSAPHYRATRSTQAIMYWVLAACLPGILVLLALYGWRKAFILLWAGCTAVALEALLLKLRQQPIRVRLLDGSALLTGVLLGIALPSYAPWWLTLIAVVCALTLGKHLYGGLGQNPFNPAMLGYAIVLVGFPLQMTTWPQPLQNHQLLSLEYIPGLVALPDAWSQPTTLDVLRNNHQLTIQELWDSYKALGYLGTWGLEWVDLAFLLGGLLLLYKRIIQWHAPVAMLVSLSLMSLIFWNGSGSDSNGSPLLHLFSGATMLGAFFIVTDPVSCATSPRGRIVFGAGVGILLYVIRTWSIYPDGLAFAVLLMNAAVPTIDYYTRPRVYGHRKPRQGFRWKE